MSSRGRYVPAAGRAAFTRLYDPAVALTMRERTFRPALVEQVLAEVPSHGTVVDVGSGTGTLAIALAAARPDVPVIGIDGDPAVLRMAAGKGGADQVTWRQGLAARLPLNTAGADAVVMSLLLHHLELAGKQSALAEARRVLRPGGRLHIADWGQPQDPLMRAAFLGLRLLDGFDTTREHATGRLHRLIETAGFISVARRSRLRTVWGSLELLSARSAGPAPESRAADATQDGEGRG